MRSNVADAPGRARTPGWLKDWSSDLDKKAAEAQRQRSEWREAEACPACATPMSPDAAECPECGLVFVEDEAP